MLPHKLDICRRGFTVCIYIYLLEVMAAANKNVTGTVQRITQKQHVDEEASVPLFAQRESFVQSECAHTPQRVCGHGCDIYHKRTYDMRTPNSFPIQKLHDVCTTSFLKSPHDSPVKSVSKYSHNAVSPKHLNFLPNNGPGLYQEVADCVKPIFCGFQLVGDSLLLRFAEQILQKDCIYADGLRFLGLCVSGQTIDQLRMRIQSRFAPVGKKIILLIGTNDMLQYRDIDDMKSAFDKLIEVLEETVEKIVLLSLPPIPKLEDQIGFRSKFRNYNDFLKLYQRKYKNIVYVDITDLFLLDEERSNLKYFERWYDETKSRPDLIHLNYEGLVLVCEKLIKSRSLNALDKSILHH